MNAIRETRKKLGITPTNAAASLGISSITLTKWENMSDLTELKYKHLAALSRLLDKPVSFFVEKNH